jgi:hypothetical protein
MSVFQKDLDYSRSLSEDQQWMTIYRAMFGDGLQSACDTGAGNEWQRHGVDRILILSCGRIVRIDEKKRRKDYGDFLAEIWSPWFGPNDPRNGLGWAVDPKKRCDYIAYGPSRGIFHVLPFDILRLTVKREHQHWQERTTDRDLAERKYLTVNRSVGWDELFRAMRRTQEIEGGTELKFEKRGTIDGQDVFTFMRKES